MLMDAGGGVLEARVCYCCVVFWGFRDSHRGSALWDSYWDGLSTHPLKDAFFDSRSGPCASPAAKRLPSRLVGRGTVTRGVGPWCTGADSGADGGRSTALDQQAMVCMSIRRDSSFSGCSAFLELLVGQGGDCAGG